VRAAGGRFLEGPVSGSKKPAIDGQLIILAAGDESLFKDCAAAFDVMGKRRCTHAASALANRAERGRGKGAGGCEGLLLLCINYHKTDCCDPCLGV
jgi:hypothetical protein